MEEFQGGVCGGMCWNPPLNLFSGGLLSPCSVTQLGGGGFDMGNFGWQNDVIKGKSNNNNTIFDNLFFSDQMDPSLDILGFGLSPTSSTTDWNHQNLMCNNENNEANFGSIIQENVTNCTNQDASPSMGMTASSNSSSGDSSTITCEGVLPNTFQINSSASYLIQSLFDDSDDQSQSISHHDHQQQFINPITSNFGSLDSCNEIISSTNSWVNSLPDHHDNHHQNSNQYPNIQSIQSNKLDEGFNSLINGHAQVLNGQYSPKTLDNIRVSLLNSLQSRSRASFGTKVNSEEHRRESKNNSSNKDQSPAKRPRIETPSPLPTFKVRKEKLGDRITALQQLVSPFGKTDTASVLHEAIEYIKFLHDQVLSTPYLKCGTEIQQQGCEKLKDNDGDNQDLRSKGLCLVPISSTYPMTQETPIDFWTPTFGGTTFR
ncbi:transcription factor bHLH112-like isoform X2 [Amaranthus tricolor]|uniref:transcription factor bHLH112-like isoform X2 n=1 Tax=Amaranthus tricolor TaxID=29722 RepID=UPI00258BA215|nr:transcription factor bHLH112-like isoform X2 [Amaranthus tricolor]